MNSKERGKRKIRAGIVTSTAMDKTIVVQVEQLVKHAKYKKYVRRRVKFKAHDEQNNCRVGDRVVIVECRPLSKEKNWRLRDIVERAV